jgi:ketosteroid isomerase-like protein
MASIYAEDAVTYEAGNEPFRGRTAIRDDYAAAVQAGIQEIDTQIIDVDVAASGDLAYELGSGAPDTRETGRVVLTRPTTREQSCGGRLPERP